MSTTLTPTLATNQRVNVLWSNVALVALAIVSLIVHSYNMFGFPLYLGDEGIFMSRAYAILELNQLTTYAYWYDHAPAGWIAIALWTVVTGGFHTFDTVVDGGRAFMLLLHVASLVMLYRIIIRVTNNTFAATAAGLLYALSPLGIVYGRMVLLENIMVFWALLATILLLKNDGYLWPIVFSGLAFGMATLTKESAFLLLPGLVYGVWTLADKHHARFARAGWLFGALASFSLYLLYAALRTELIDLSLSSPLAGDEDKVTLLGAIIWQVSRLGGIPWNPSSDFFQALTTNWLVRDPWLLVLGVAATAWNLFRGSHQARMLGILSLCAILGVVWSGEVLEFYIVPVLPFLAINVGVAAASIASMASVTALAPALLIGVMAIGWLNLNTQMDMFTLNLTETQRQTLDWVQEHVPSNAQIIVDDDLLVDLRDGAPGKPDFAGAHSHWKVANDPAVYEDLFFENWRNIDYLIMTPGLEEIFEQERDKLPYKAYSRSTSIKTFNVGDAEIDIRKVNHPGIGVEDQLDQTYESFRKRFIQDGQVRPVAGYTDARDQTTAMLMAVWQDDRETFNDLWMWTSLHLQRENNLLFHTNEPGATPRSATNADTDAAVALLLAERRWDDGSYGRAALQIIQALWDNAVVEIDGTPYLAAGDWAVTEDQVIFAPTTFAPYAYRFFAEADSAHDWAGLLDNSYELLAEVSVNRLGEARSAGLPPAYVGINRETGELNPNPAGVPVEGNTFNEDVAQVYWRVALDEFWNEDDRATDILTASDFLSDEWQSKEELAAEYAHNGTPQTHTESLIMYSAVFHKFLAQDETMAHELYAKKLATAFAQTETEQFWGDNDDIAQQQWAWLTTGLYVDKFGLYNDPMAYEWETAE